jgi:hypothetical protein
MDRLGRARHVKCEKIPEIGGVWIPSDWLETINGAPGRNRTLEDLPRFIGRSRVRISTYPLFYPLRVKVAGSVPNFGALARPAVPVVR